MLARACCRIRLIEIDVPYQRVTAKSRSELFKKQSLLVFGFSAQSESRFGNVTPSFTIVSEPCSNSLSLSALLFLMKTSRVSSSRTRPTFCCLNLDGMFQERRCAEPVRLSRPKVMSWGRRTTSGQTSPPRLKATNMIERAAFGFLPSLRPMRHASRVIRVILDGIVRGRH